MASSKPPASESPYDHEIDRVLHALHAARTSVQPGLTKLRKRDHIRARLAEGRSVDHLLVIVEFAAYQCRHDPKQLEWLDTVTPFRPKNFEQRLARAQAWKLRGATTGQRFDTTPEDVKRLLSGEETPDAPA